MTRGDDAGQRGRRECQCGGTTEEWEEQHPARQQQSEQKTSGECGEWRGRGGERETDQPELRWAWLRKTNHSQQGHESRVLASQYHEGWREGRST